ncbi:MAG: Gfo/Idh/MocA family oxidoreductase [Bacteroidetes bacterium]|nr:Gfo/Idh/MocA family oxidoreductase [Bacteroidota bacterium]
MKKFLICGLGSIGQRHVRIIRTVTNGEAEIAVYRKRKLDIVISDKLDANFGTDPVAHYELKNFESMEEAFEWSPNAVFVTNPISMHVETAIAAALNGSNIFIEKPLGCSQHGIGDLFEIIKKKNLTCMVGYQLRYHPGYRKLERLLMEEVLGKVISVDLHFGEWLPGMHPYEDYRESHAARSDQGGGVIFCLSHMVDIAYWLFGLPKSVYALGGHLSNLEMDVEDTVDIVLNCEKSGHKFPVHIHLDFLQKPARCYTHIIGSKGSAYFDYSNSLLEINLISEKPEEIKFDTFQRNDMFIDEVRDFINCAKLQTQPSSSLVSGANVLAICLAAKKSLKTGKIAKVK